MRCTIVGNNLKTFSKSIRLMSKYSDYVKIVAKRDFFVFQAVNDSKSAFCEVTYGQDFFANFDFKEDFDCKVDIRSLVAVFQAVNLERTTDTCKIVMDHGFNKILFEMKCKYSITEEWSIPYMDSEAMKCPRISEKMSKPTFRAPSKLLTDILQHFPNSTQEAVVWLYHNAILFKTFVVDEENIQETITSFALSPHELIDYNHTQDLLLTIYVRDVKAFLDFSNYRNQMVSVYLQEGGKPIEFVFRNSDDYSARVTLATVSFDDTYVPQPPQIKIPSHNSTVLTGNTQDSSLTSISVEQAEENRMEVETVNNERESFPGEVAVVSSAENQQQTTITESIGDTGEQEPSQISDNNVMDSSAIQCFSPDENVDNNANLKNEITDLIDVLDSVPDYGEDSFVNSPLTDTQYEYQQKYFWGKEEEKTSKSFITIASDSEEESS